jgi:uncharacterized protein (TIGR02594 family)
MADPFWLAEARKYIGQREIAGRRHNPLILRWWTLIRAPFTDDETPWCAGFVGGILESVKIKSSRSAAARSYLNWGQKLDRAVVGAIVVFSRPGSAWSGHVGFVVGVDARGNLMVLGGNQGNMVSIRPFDRRRVLGYRWPEGLKVPVGSLPVLASDGKLSANEA